MAGISVPKEGDIVINHQNSDPIAKVHPLLQIDYYKALIMTSKAEPTSGDKTFEITSKDVVDFSISGNAYVSDREVETDSGRVIGKVKSSIFKQILNWK